MIIGHPEFILDVYNSNTKLRNFRMGIWTCDLTLYDFDKGLTTFNCTSFGSSALFPMWF